jgi:hypothetical protein
MSAKKELFGRFSERGGRKEKVLGVKRVMKSIKYCLKKG